MDPLNRLKRDHQILRSKLNVLESALHAWPGSWFVVREISFTLARLVEVHREREAQAAIAWFVETGVASTADDHGDALRQLRAINRHFAGQADDAPPCPRRILRGVIAELRRQCERQDAWLVWALGAHPIQAQADDGVGISGAELVTDEMTVDQVVRLYPVTRHVLEDLFISCVFERYECLDEVAWKHGLEASELLGRLRAAISNGLEDEGLDVAGIRLAPPAGPITGARHDGDY